MPEGKETKCAYIPHIAPFIVYAVVLGTAMVCWAFAEADLAAAVENTDIWRGRYSQLLNSSQEEGRRLREEIAYLIAERDAAENGKDEAERETLRVWFECARQGVYVSDRE